MNFNTPLLERLRWKVKCVEKKILNYRLSTNEYVQADTEYGKIRGQKRLTVYGDSYYSFEGIPYAQPPVGELRFKSPQRPTPWVDVKDCLAPRDKSVQLDFITGKVCGSEDCLYLNVYTNDIAPKTSRPVMVYIHGGAYMCGEATRDYNGPDYFIKKDIVLITIQYRLCCLGFLSLEDRDVNVPGNAGLKDQLLALKWVKNNCSHFGGNPDNITLFGHSAGSASTNFMMVNDQARGLFHRAILVSGNILCVWATSKCQSNAYRLAELLGYKGENKDKDVFEFLSKAKAYDLVKCELKTMLPNSMPPENTYPFAPTIEPYKSSDCIVDKPFSEMFKCAWGNSIPTMMTYNSFEGLCNRVAILQNPSLLDDMDTCVKFVPLDLADSERSSSQTQELGAELKSLHVKGDKGTMDELMDLFSYEYCLLPMYRFLQCRFLDNAAVPVHLLRFDFDSEVLVNPYRIMNWNRGIKGVSHGDELSYLFWTVLSHRVSKDSHEYKTIERMIDIFTQFASSDNPFNKGINGLEDLTWEAVKKDDHVYKCLNVGNELSFIELPEMEKLRKWADLYKKHNNK